MSPQILNGLLAASASPLVGLLEKATVIALLGLSAARLSSGTSAAVRHLILTGTLQVLLLLPFLMPIVPVTLIGIPVAFASRTKNATVGIDNSQYARPTATDTITTSASAPFSNPHSWRQITVSELVGVLWSLGTALFMLPLIGGIAEARQLKREASLWPDGQSTLSGLACSPHRKSRSAVLLHHGGVGPCTFGSFRPAIILPVSAQGWASEDLRRVLLHEMEHVRRWDWLTYSSACAARALYWFHPLIWLLKRQLAIEAERSCDDAVLREADALCYANQLVSFAEQHSTRVSTPALALVDRTAFATRVRAILDRTQYRGRVSCRLVVVAFLAASVIGVTVASLGLVAVAESVHVKDVRQGSQLTFDAAVIREWPSDRAPRTRGPVRRQNPGRIFAQAADLAALVRFAFNLNGSAPIEGLPKWSGLPGATFGSSAEFFVDARMPASTTDAQTRLMMQSLLGTRFGLTWHWTTKPTKVLEMLVAPGGLKLEKVDPDKAPSIPQGKTYTCPSEVSGCAFIMPHPATMDQLAGILPTRIFGRPVVDKTGLKGSFFIPELIFIYPDSITGTVPSAPTELRDVTGLELRPKTDSIPVLVIDRVERRNQ